MDKRSGDTCPKDKDTCLNAPFLAIEELLYHITLVIESLYKTFASYSTGFIEELLYLLFFIRGVLLE
ncbi:hypothetical protein Leryth_024798 [Lithospermum erythrorhizon]|nr:hypothetical protein Leryth_024798 [Lithospermum erythrorhizon]